MGSNFCHLHRESAPVTGLLLQSRYLKHDENRPEKGLFCRHILIMCTHDREEEAESERRGQNTELVERGKGGKKRRERIWEEVKGGGCG